MVQKIALVTGGAGGIGTATCIAFAKSGITVVAIDIPGRFEELKEWQQRIKREFALDIEIGVADVSDFDSCQEMASVVSRDFGVVSILVNAAGITRDETLRKMDKAQWDDVIRTDLDSIFNVTRPFIEPMVTQGFGRIINISSVNGRKGQFGQTNYSAAKAGVHGFTKALAQEVAAKGVTVNTVSPGYVATPMVMAIREDIRQRIIDQIPLGRLATPEEVAHAICFLSDENSAYITGANIDINGGMWMH